MNYRLKKEYMGKPTGISDIGCLMEPEFGMYDSHISPEPSPLLESMGQMAEKNHELYQRLCMAIDENTKLEIKVCLLEQKLEKVIAGLRRYSNRDNWDKNGVKFMLFNKGYSLARKVLNELDEEYNK